MMFWWQDDAMTAARKAAAYDGQRREVRPFAGLWRVSVVEVASTVAVSVMGALLVAAWWLA